MPLVCAILPLLLDQGFKLETFNIVIFIHSHSLFIRVYTFFLHFCIFTSLRIRYLLVCFFFKERWKFVEMKKKYVKNSNHESFEFEAQLSKRAAIAIITTQ